MALSPEITFTSESPSGDEYICVFTDSTTYGAPNPDRNDGAVYFTGEKINYDSSVDADITIASYTPSSATSFTATIVKDGWHRFKFIWIPTYDAGTTYLLYDAVDSSGVVYRALQNSFSGQAPPNASYWEVITAPTDLVDNDGTATDSANTAPLLYQIIIYPFAKETYGDLAEDFAIKCCGTFDDLEQFTAYKEIGGIVAALKASNTRERFASGEKISRYADQLAVSD